MTATHWLCTIYLMMTLICSVMFCVDAVAGSNERAKIEKLIVIIRDSNYTFVRNGKKYSSKDAAIHLKRKWRNRRTPIATAIDFIDQIASHSKQTGIGYRLIIDNKMISTQEWLYQKLEEIETDKALSS